MLVILLLKNRKIMDYASPTVFCTSVSIFADFKNR